GRGGLPGRSLLHWLGFDHFIAARLNRLVRLARCLPGRGLFHRLGLDRRLEFVSRLSLLGLLVRLGVAVVVMIMDMRPGREAVLALDRSLERFARRLSLADFGLV